MTSEIAVMNQRGIALAADSAVTLVEGGKIVVRNERRKLFNLAEGLPVAVMFFGVAEIMGHPWEVLLEHFQKTAKPGRLAHTRDYAAKFTDMLDDIEEFFPRSRQADDYRRLLASVFRYVLRVAHYLYETGGARPGSETEILRHTVEQVWHAYQFHEDGSARGDLACFPKGFAATVKRDYAEVMDEMITYAFAGFELDPLTRQRLLDICVFCVVKELFLEDVTGVVFAGYGSGETYPVVVTYSVSAVVGGIVKRAQVGHDAIDSEIHSAIDLFADCEATYAFLYGLDLDLEAAIYGTMQAMSYNIVDHVIDSFANVDAAQRESIRREFQTHQLPNYLRRFYALIADYQHTAYINPVLRVLEIATNQDLAETARDLLALNIFKKRIMAQQQTVGGAIDVAVISRESGFQWWKKQGA